MSHTDLNNEEMTSRHKLIVVPVWKCFAIKELFDSLQDQSENYPLLDCLNGRNWGRFLPSALFLEPFLSSTWESPLQVKGFPSKTWSGLVCAQDGQCDMGTRYFLKSHIHSEGSIHQWVVVTDPETPICLEVIGTAPRDEVVYINHVSLDRYGRELNLSTFKDSCASILAKETTYNPEISVG